MTASRYIDVEPDLRREFPSVFHEPLQFGAHVGPGWVSLLRELADELEPMFEAYPIEARPVVMDVKTKLGLLRINVIRGNPEIHRAIMRAERASESICEVCGLEGSGVSERGWMAVMCGACRHA